MAGLLRAFAAVAAVAAVAVVVVLVAFMIWQPDPSAAAPASGTVAPNLRAAQAPRPTVCDIRATKVDGIASGRPAGAGVQAQPCLVLTGPAPVIPEVGLPVLLPVSTALTVLAVVLLRRARKHSARRRQG
jgi:hypothetical protein